MDGALAVAIRTALGAAVRDSRPVHGGDVAIAFQVELADGRRVFAKTHRAPPPGFFTTEASGLSWLAEADSVPVPAVLAVSDEPAFLVLTWIETAGGARPAEDAPLGRALADLHRAGAPVFGREDRRTTGSRALPNDPCDTWVEFFATRRLLPLARLARDGGALPDRVIADLEAVAGRLVDRAGRSWLIDPAAHGGHREFDLAMMALFGGFGPDCVTAYDDAFPLAADWRDRVALHQIAPLVVHAIKFGGSYVDAATEAIARYA